MQRVGQNGPLLLQDFHLIDLLAHFDRERIPERVVHAKGAGAFGEFEVTDDISDLVSFCRLDFQRSTDKLRPRWTCSLVSARRQNVWRGSPPLGARKAHQIPRETLEDSR